MFIGAINLHVVCSFSLVLIMLIALLDCNGESDGSKLDLLAFTSTCSCKDLGRIASRNRRLDFVIVIMKYVISGR